ncbi:ABC transporter permease subunit [soil metagenome]
MNASLVIARYTFRECVRRRVFVVVPIVTVLFLGLYGLGNHFAFQFDQGTIEQGPGILVDARSLTGATLVGLSMFTTLFLGSVLAVFLTFGTVRGDAEVGLLQPLVVRPIGRPMLLLGRFLGTSLIAVLYTLLLFLACVLITGTVGGWWPSPLVLPGLELAAGVVIVAALSLLGSVFLSPIVNGISVFMLYGAGLLGGLLGQIGEALDSNGLKTVGNAMSWAVPFEALYQAALYSLTSSTTGLTHVIVQLGPLGGAQPGSLLLAAWAPIYLVVIAFAAKTAFSRRDL